MYLFDLNNEINFIVDTASPASLLPARLYKEHADLSDTGPDLLGPDGRPLRMFGSVELCFRLPICPVKLSINFM